MKPGRMLQGVWVADAADRRRIRNDSERHAVFEIVQGALERFDWTRPYSGDSTTEFVDETAALMAGHAIEWLSDGPSHSSYAPITDRQMKTARALAAGTSPDETAKRLLGNIKRGSVQKRPKLQGHVNSVVRAGIDSSIQEAAWTLRALYGVALDKAQECDISPSELTMNSLLLILELARLNKQSDPAVIRYLSNQTTEKNITYPGMEFDSSRFRIDTGQRGAMLVAKIDLPDDERFQIQTPGCPAQQNRGILLFSRYMIDIFAAIEAGEQPNS